MFRLFKKTKKKTFKVLIYINLKFVYANKKKILDIELVN